MADPSKEYLKYMDDSKNVHERKRLKERAGTVGTSLVHSLLTEKEKVRSWVPGEKEYLEEDKGVTDATHGKIMRGKHKGKPMKKIPGMTNIPKKKKDESEY